MYSIYYPLLSQLFLVVPGPPLLPFLHSLVHLLSILFHHLQPTLQPEVTHAYHNGEWMPDNSLTEIQQAHFHTEFTVRQLVHRGQGSSFSHRIYCQSHRRVLEIQRDILLGLISVTHSSETLKVPNTAEAILMFYSCLFL